MQHVPQATQFTFRERLVIISSFFLSSQCTQSREILNSPPAFSHLFMRGRRTQDARTRIVYTTYHGARQQEITTSMGNGGTAKQIMTSQIVWMRITVAGTGLKEEVVQPTLISCTITAREVVVGALMVVMVKEGNVVFRFSIDIELSTTAYCNCKIKEPGVRRPKTTKEMADGATAFQNVRIDDYKSFSDKIMNQSMDFILRG